MATGDRLERIHLCGNAEGVDNENGARARRDGPLDRCGVEIEGDGVNLGKDGRWRAPGGRHWRRR